MSDWKCGKCLKVYEFDDFMKLKNQRMKSVEDDPDNKYGYTNVCDCGYVFHKDKWIKRETVELNKSGTKKYKVDVSTVFLELEHMGGMYYETMIFPQSSELISHFQERYKTQEKAEAGHQEVIRKIKDKEIHFQVTEKELIIDD